MLYKVWLFIFVSSRIVGMLCAMLPYIGEFRARCEWLSVAKTRRAGYGNSYVRSYDFLSNLL